MDHLSERVVSYSARQREGGKGDLVAPPRTRATPQLARVAAARSARIRRRVVESRLTAGSKQTTLLLVRWGLVAVCSFLLVEGDSAAATTPLGLVVVATLVASNLALGRLRAETIEGVALSVG